MRKWSSRLVLAAMLSVFPSVVSIACPHCNIYNYLCPSVRSSSNIVIGVVERGVDDYATLVNVEKVLRGTNAAGSSITFKTHGMKDAAGRRFIFSDPQASPPTFEVLPEDLEWEVSYLIRGVPTSANDWEYEHHQSLAEIPDQLQPRPRDPEEALRAIQGVSEVTRESGIEYAKRNREDMFSRIQKQLSLWGVKSNTKETDDFADHSLDGLVEAMWKTDAAAASGFFTNNLAERCGKVAGG
jgi:hypothetical protein